MRASALLLLIVLSLLLSACQTSPTESVSSDDPSAGFTSPERVAGVSASNLDESAKTVLLTGTWYGRQISEGGGIHEWIAHHVADGTIRIRFRSDPVGNVTVIGYWGVAAEYFADIKIAQVVNGIARPVDDLSCHIYRIDELTGDKFVYTSIRTGSTYTAIRVPEDFEFPPREEQAPTD